MRWPGCRPNAQVVARVARRNRALHAHHRKAQRLVRPVCRPAPLAYQVLVACRSRTRRRLRQCALDFIVTVAEEAGSLARRSELLFQQAVPLSLSLMSTVEEDPTWRCRTEDNTDEDDEHPLPAAGEQALDRMALSLGAAIVVCWVRMVYHCDCVVLMCVLHVYSDGRLDAVCGVHAVNDFMAATPCSHTGSGHCRGGVRPPVGSATRFGARHVPLLACGL